MKQSTIKIIFWTFIALGLLSSMVSCNDATMKNDSSRDVVIPGKDINSGIKRALVIDSLLNIYSAGDTVWVYNGRITQNTWEKDIPTSNYSLFVITDNKLKKH